MIVVEISCIAKEHTASNNILEIRHESITFMSMIHADLQLLQARHHLSTIIITFYFNLYYIDQYSSCWVGNVKLIA